MVKIIQLRSSSEAYDDAASWIARLDKGISLDEREELRLWLDCDPQRRLAFLELAALWDGLDALAELSDLFPLDRSTPQVRRRTLLPWVAAAASAVAVAAMALWTFDNGPRSATSSTTAVPVAETLKEDFRTVVGGREVRTLPDGSVVTLNTDTELAVDYSAAARDVFLKRGEASFSVVRNESKPFRVHIGDRVVQAVGTAFNVQLRPSGDVEITVSEGRVRVTKTLPLVPERPQLSLEQTNPLDTILSEGEAAVLGMLGVEQNIRPQVLQLDSADIGIKLAWQNGMIIFQGEPLPTVLREVSRYANVEFVLTDDTLATIRVGGFFRTGDIDGLLDALHDNFQIESAVAADNRIVLSPAR